MASAIATKLQPTAPALGASAFVGRDAELHRLVSVCAAAPAMVLVEGEPGIGKTRLIDEALAAAPLARCRQLRAGCHWTPTPFPLGPVLDAVRGIPDVNALTLNPVVGALRPLLPELAPWLPRALEALADRAAERHQAFRALCELLDALGPTIVVLEDVHWADHVTAEFLRYVVGQPLQRASFIVSYRSEQLGPDVLLPDVDGRAGAWSRARVSLEPLSMEHVAAVVGGILGGQHLSDEFAAYLHERSAGLPFAVEQVVGLLMEQGDVVQREGRWYRKAINDMRVPRGIVDSVLQRLRHLGETSQRLVEASAVVGQTADHELLSAVSAVADEDVARALADAVRSGLMIAADGGGYACRHALVRDAIYAGLDRGDRLGLHRRAADALKERGGPAAELVVHCKASGDIEGWAAAAQRAAAQARADGNDEAAALVLLDALHADLSPEQYAEIALGAGYAALEARAHAVTIPHLEAAQAHSHVAEAIRGELQFVLGLLWFQAGDRSAAAEWSQRATGLLASRPDLCARALGTIAVATDDPARARDSVDQAWAQASTQDDKLVRMIVAVDRADVLLRLGDPQGAAALAAVPDPGQSAAMRRQFIRAQNNAAWLCARAGTYSSARTSLAAARGAGGEQWPRVAVHLDSTEIVLDLHVGAWNGLAQRAERFVAANEDNPLACIGPRHVVACLALAAGEQRAQMQLERVWESGPASIFLAHAALLRWTVAVGDSQAAADRAQDLMILLPRDRIHAAIGDAGPALVHALVAGGAHDEALRWVDEQERALSGLAVPAATAALTFCRGLLDPTHAVALLDRAALAWAALPRPYDAALAALSAAELLAARDPDAALSRARDGLAALERLPAPWDAARWRQRLRSAGLDLPSKRGRRSYGNELSPRERDVLVLVASGKTNREVGAELFLSPRTVEDHLARGMRKLGLESRRTLMVHGVPDQRPDE